MEHLETQVSDLRSFLPGSAQHASAIAAPAPAPAPAPASATATASASASAPSPPTNLHVSSYDQLPHVSVQGLNRSRQASLARGGPSHPRHGHGIASQQAPSPLSAFGGNSAQPSPASPQHPSPYPLSAHTTNAHPTPTHIAGPMSASALGSAPHSLAAAGHKRKSDDPSPVGDDGGPGKQQRSKRNRYISIACNECKRRKIKCNGETPCQRCGNLNLACLYAPNCCSNSFKESDEYKQMNDNISRLQEQMESLSRLQEQMDSLQRKMSAIQQESMRLAPIQDSRALPAANAGPIAPSPSASITSSQRQDLTFRPPVLFRGPTSATSHVDVAKNTLHNMGYAGAEANEEVGIHLEDTPAPSPAPGPEFAREHINRPQDPLWEFDIDEMTRLCRVHEEEVGIMYPVVNINDVINYAKGLVKWMTSARTHDFVAPGTSFDEVINDIKTLELKIIMCCALVVEGNGYSSKANRIWESISPTVDRMLMSDPSQVTTLPFLALVGGYRFLANEEVLAWRVMGQVARLCLEMGLHRRDGIAKIGSEQERKNAINTFWSAYVLDRRWSFGTGFPFVVHDDKIDPGLPYPDEHPYLTSLIAFSRLSAKIWRLVDYFDSVLIHELKREDFIALDREILDWYETVPEKIRIQTFSDRLPIPGTPTYDIDRLQIWTRLRLNQIRIWLYTPVLHSASSITQNNDLAQRVVNLAKDTIQYLSRLNSDSVVYRRIQVFYHHFLTSAIAVLFVASTHAPVSFSAQCREEFNMALELIKDLSPKSWVSQRLWRTVRSLKAYAPKLGLQQDEMAFHGNRENTALTTLAGLATNGQPHALSVTSTQGGSISSAAGHQPTPSPGLTPGYGGYANSTPHSVGGRTSPLPTAEQHGQSNGNNHTTASPNDQNNGIRLQTEMLRMYEGFGNGVGQLSHDELYGGGSMGDYAAAGRHYGMNGNGEGVFPLMKEMF